MSLSAVLKRAGHECIMFDQANPETPNEVIVDEIRRQQPDLVGLSFLSTTSYPYAKILARQIRAADSRVRLAFGGVFATLNAELVKLQCPEVNFVCRGDGEQLILDLLERFDDPDDVAGLTWEKDGRAVHNPNRGWIAPLINGRSRTGRVCLWILSNPCRSTCLRCCRWSASPRCRPRAAVLGRAYFATFRSSTKASGARAARSTWSTSSSTCSRWVMAPSILSTIIFSSNPSGSRRSAKASTTTASTSNGAARDAWIPPRSTFFPPWRKPIVAR